MQFINRACMIGLLCTINDSYAMSYLYMIHHYRQMQLSLAVYIYIYNSVRLFVCLFVCSFAIRAKTTAQNVTKLSGFIKWGSASVLHGLKSPVLQFLKRYPSIFGFSFAADGHFLNYRSLDFRLSDGLIRCRSTIDFKLGRRYSSYQHIRQNWLGPTLCCATRHSRARRRRAPC